MAGDDSDSFVSSDASLDGIIEESAAFTKEDIRVCSLTPSDWPLDSGATSHMSDQLSRCYVDTGTTATEKGLSTAESDDVLMDDIAVETSGTPDNTTAQTIDEES
ncbi:hypothetical protein E4U51_004402 [Claviceps purpurea]|nr:hypothetical protein E4U51_004402 [Claviceps purpurea]